MHCRSIATVRSQFLLQTSSLKITRETLAFLAHPDHEEKSHKNFTRLGQPFARLLRTDSTRILGAVYENANDDSRVVAFRGLCGGDADAGCAPRGVGRCICGGCLLAHQRSAHQARAFVGIPPDKTLLNRPFSAFMSSSRLRIWQNCAQ